MQFKEYRELIRKQYEKHSFRFKGNVSPDMLWETYLNAFPEEERQSHNCNCCKQFIKECGALVDIVDGEVVTIWDLPGGKAEYENVSAKMREVVLKYSTSANPYFTHVRIIGTDSNIAMKQVEGQSPQTITWNHFSVPAKPHMYKAEANIPSESGEIRQQKGVFLRSLNELNLQAIATVIELIDERLIHRGEEYLKAVTGYRDVFQKYKSFPKGEDMLTEDLRIWDLFVGIPLFVARLGASVIGTLLYDLIEDKKSLTNCVHAFNHKMSPENYMRVKPIFTAKQAEAAAKAIADLGLEKALDRRFATIEDLSAEHVLFLNEQTTVVLPQTGALGLLGSMASSATSVDADTLKHAKELPIDEFINTTLKKSQRVEVFFDSRNQNNLVSLITTDEKEPRSLFKWNNLFSWNYNDALADSSLREKVQKAGGSTEGELRISLGWHNYDDLDLHFRTVSDKNLYGGNSIYHAIRSRFGGRLDVDANASSRTKTPVENIIFENLNHLPDGEYVIVVNQYNRRESVDNTFTLEVETAAGLHTYEGVNPSTGGMSGSGKNAIHTFRLKKDKGAITVLNPNFGHKQTKSKEIWGINTNQFHDVNVIINSPNYWGNNAIGNRHLFFFINKAKSEGMVRGIFNEFLHSDLIGQHRKTFEALGSKLEVKSEGEQLSGLGFSSTFKNDIIVRVTQNNKQELYKILF